MSSGLRRARFTVAYDGTSFHGFAENDGVRTVMGEFRDAVERVVRRPVELVGAGRTDAGVHGWGQVVSCDLPDDTDLDGLVRRINRMCGPQVVARSAEWTAAPDFSARFSAKWRHYRYDVWNAPQPNAFLATTSWHVSAPLSLPALRLSCDPLIGEHDFTSFCRRPKLVEGLARSCHAPQSRRGGLKRAFHPVSAGLRRGARSRSESRNRGVIGD